MRKTTLLISVLLFLSTHLYSQPVTWDSSTSYSTGALVIVGTSTYIATKSVPANNTPPNTTYWTDLSVAATALNVPVEDVPTLSTDTILASLPGSAPDANSTGASGTIQIFSLSTRAGLFGNDMAASLNMGGTTASKKVMFRVKGPSIGNFAGARLADPNLDLYHKDSSGRWLQVVKSSTFGSYTYQNASYTDSTSGFTDRHTGNNLEPLVVYSLTPDVYSCVVGSDAGTGNAIVEIYSLDDNSSSYFNSLSTRGYVSGSEISGSLRLVGSGKKKIMFRVKGPSIGNFSGVRLADPYLDIWHKTSDGSWVQVVKSSTFGSYTFQNASYTNVTASYTSRHTGNNLEPMVVYELEEGTYSCLVGSDGGGQGNANLEIYSLE
jgi:hypothetical protein